MFTYILLLISFIIFFLLEFFGLIAPYNLSVELFKQIHQNINCVMLPVYAEFVFQMGFKWPYINSV